MKRFAMAGFFTCILFVTGCGDITGKWTLDCIEPESERQNFDLKCLVLRDDNTFLLKACEDAKPAAVCGTYCYDKDTNTLTFTPEGGAPARTYIAEVGLLGFGKMKVCPTGEKAWTAYLKRCKCEPCDKCKPCPGKCKPCPDKCNKPCPDKCKHHAKCDKPCPKPCEKPAEKTPECPMHRAEPVQKN